MSSHQLFFFSFFITAQITFYGQVVDKKDSDFNLQIESIAEKKEDENIDYTDFLQTLSHFRKYPININYTNESELKQLQLLNDIEINYLLAHIEKHGKLLTIHELQAIEGFDIYTIDKILPFVIVSDQVNVFSLKFKNIIEKGNHFLLLRGQQILEKQKGYGHSDSAALIHNPNSAYLGGQQKIYSRYRFNYGQHINFGITAEKDAGEEFFKNSQQQGFDFYSAHCYIGGMKTIKGLVIGDYHVSYGQGLVAWSGLAFDKSSDAINVKKNALGIKPYMSVDENRFMRGIATTIAIKNIEISGFYSNKNIDATVSPADTNSVQTEISTIRNTGYHRLPSELAGKDMLGEKIIGGNIKYQKRRFSVGVTSFNTFLNKQYNRNLSYYNQFEFSSNHLSNVGIDYSWNIQNFNFFGETAISDNGAIAYINGVLMALDSRLSVVLLHRDYQKNYQSLYSNGFSENTDIANEKGVYFGANAKLTNQININFYYDRFVFPWLKYRVNAPSNGNDYLVQLNYIPSKNTQMYFRIRQHNRLKNLNDLSAIDYPVMNDQANYRYHISYKVSPLFSLANRVETIILKIDSKKETGYMIYQDVRYRSNRGKISLTARYVLFSTDSYNSRIYAYESDVTNSYSIPSYYDKGSRFYLLTSYQINNKLEVAIRYGQTIYENKTKLNEGSLDEITGNTKSELKLNLLLLL